MRGSSARRRSDAPLPEAAPAIELDREWTLRGTKAAKQANAARTTVPKAPAKPKATKDATGTDDAAAPKQREGTRKATVIALLEREGGATLEEIMAATGWQKHSIRGFISTLGSKHGYTVANIRRETDKARAYAIE
jgi:hypothetical protein